MGEGGYSEYQRTQNWDGPVLRTQGSGLRIGTQKYGRFNCSRYGYLSGVYKCTDADVTLIFRWWEGKTGGQMYGERVIQIASGVELPLQYRVPNMGPWVEIIVKPKTEVVEYHDEGRFGLNNRDHPLEAIPQSTLLLNNQAVKVPATSTVNVFPKCYYAGPAIMQLKPVAEAGTWKLEVEVSPEVYVTVKEGAIPKATETGFEVILPLGAWRLAVSNASAVEQTYSATVIAPITGSM